MKKFMRIYLNFLCVFTMLNSVVYATGGYKSNSATDIAKKIPTLLNAIAWIGYAVALGMFIYIGIKYMLSAANEKATLKEGLVNYVIGGILIASASIVANIVASIAAGGEVGTAGSLADKLINTATDAAGFSTVTGAGR